MNPERQQLIERAKELNFSDYPPEELRDRIHQVCSEYLIEAKVDVDRLLRHEDWLVRFSALDLVSWGLGATDGVDETINILIQDSDEDVRSYAACTLWQYGRGTAKAELIKDALRKAVAEDESDYVRDSARKYLSKFDQE